jgi:D-alanine transaminase
VGKQVGANVSDIVYLNGQYLPLAQAKIPVLDRGFLFGDGVYEVIPAYGRMLFRLKEHLARLATSLTAIRLTNPHNESEWSELLNAVVDHNPWDDQTVYLQVTRGSAPRTHEFPKTRVAPTVFIMSSTLKAATPEQREHGVPVITREDYRWQRCDIKCTSLLANCLLRQEADEAGASETILLRDGHLTEASACNVFLVKGGVTLTPPKDNLILPGITYDLVLELARANALPVEVRPILASELFEADEVWLTSSSREVLPVTRIDGRRVGDGRPGAAYRRMYRLFQDYKASVRRAAHA